MKSYINDIETYKAGKSKINTTLVRKITKLSSNENALGCSPRVLEYLQGSFISTHTYPDSNASELKEKLSTKFNINPQQITIGSGSDEILSFICHGFLGEGDEIIQSQYGFLMYSIYSKKFGAKIVKVKEENNQVSSVEILQNINSKTKIIFLANPNNPTAAILTTTKLCGLLKKIPQNIIFVLDLAYIEFIDDQQYQQPFDLVNKFPNLIITRTFSKIHGLASLRIGYSYSSLEIAQYLDKIKGPFNTSAIAQKCAIISLGDDEFFQRSIAHNKNSLDILTKEFSNLGIKYYPSLINFLLLEFSSVKQCQKINQKLLEEGVILRDATSYNLPKCLRMTIGTEDDNAKVLEILKNCFT
jgi:histidinol-phosphate aminotransferase